MIIYDLKVDHDCTLRSSAHSAGLFSTRELAEEALASLGLDEWQYSRIDERVIDKLEEWAK